MASNTEIGGEQPTNPIDLQYLIEIAPEEPIEELRKADQADPSLDNKTGHALVDLKNVLTPDDEEEKKNVTTAHTEEEENPLTPRPYLHDDEGNQYMTLDDWFAPIDLDNVDHVQQVVQVNSRYAALYTLGEELNCGDPMQTWPYAMEVFSYQKEREKGFIIKDYMPHQTYLSPWKRRLLVSWMVTVHQAFGTYRETFFLSVKIFDLYLSTFVVAEDMLQLLAATAMNIASKYEEKKGLEMETLLSFCHWEYTVRDLVQMERDTLMGLGFNLGIPIAYRFVRRYARSAYVPEPIWTMATYILELNLLEYSNVGLSDSKVAAAALFMALRMCGEASELDENTWNATLVYYSGYELPQFAWLVPVLNAVLHGSYCDTVKNVRSLYSSSMLYDVASVPLVTNEELFLHNPEQLG